MTEELKKQMESGILDRKIAYLQALELERRIERQHRQIDALKERQQRQIDALKLGLDVW